MNEALLKLIEKDLAQEYPEIDGLCPGNILLMRKFAEAWPDKEIMQRTVARLSWHHNVVLINNLSREELWLWFSWDVLSLEIGMKSGGFFFELEIKFLVVSSKKQGVIH